MHYRYDPERHERRNVVVAAFDDETEFQDRIAELAADLHSRRDSAEPPDPRERISGVQLDPGYHALQRNAHLLRRAIAHGVPPRAMLNLPMPSNVAIGMVVRDDREK